MSARCGEKKDEIEAWKDCWDVVGRGETLVVDDFCAAEFFYNNFDREEGPRCQVCTRKHSLSRGPGGLTEEDFNTLKANIDQRADHVARFTFESLAKTVRERYGDDNFNRRVALHYFSLHDNDEVSLPKKSSKPTE